MSQQIFISLLFFVLLSGNLHAQTEFTFEDSAKWKTTDGKIWSISSERNFEGKSSLSYSIPKGSDINRNGIYSIDTDHTISLVRTAKGRDGEYIIASTYEGAVLGISYAGLILWKNNLGKGIMNHDVWCADITGDGIDEVLLANANGTTYCLNSLGQKVWEFKVNQAPMYAVCVVHKNNIPYVVCGGYDMAMYYLSSTGSLVKKVHSTSYSIEKPWGNPRPKYYHHVTNFIRPLKKEDGSELLAVYGVMDVMRAGGTFYLMEPLSDIAISSTKEIHNRSLGEMRMFDIDDDGNEDVLFASSGMIESSFIGKYHIDSKTYTRTDFNQIPNYRNYMDHFGYRITKPMLVEVNGEQKILALFGSSILTFNTDLEMSSIQSYRNAYSYNDIWKASNNRLIMAGSQAGGSCVHIIDLNNPNWTKAYEELEPIGKIAKINANVKKAWEQLDGFARPVWEREPLEVNILSNHTTGIQPIIDDINTNYNSPVMYTSPHINNVQTPESWNRDDMENAFYRDKRDKRDKRKKYVFDQQESVNDLLSRYEPGYKGFSYAAGHGADPYYFSLETHKTVLDAIKGKHYVTSFLELESHSDDFAWMLNDYMYPLAEYMQTKKNARIYLRNKNVFWQGSVYLPMWSRLTSGEFADVFVSSMEETTDKTMDLSLIGRVGLWMSGATNTWGAHCSRDNASFDRLRQNSHQMLPNHFLRQLIYSVACGAKYVDNFAVKPEHMSLYFMLIAKGALYVPERNEILSISPIHLSMKEPDEDYMYQGTNVKWVTYFDEKHEAENPMVFNMLNGSWPGAELYDWDFSKYASGVKDRRMNFLPPCPNGMVLVTPVQLGVFAQKNTPRGLMKDALHPIYKDIMKEYITDGRNYYSADGKQVYKADEYYTVIKKEIEEAAKLLPVTVSGDDVAWVVAQSSPTHLRLTLVDGGYVNPDDREVAITFHTVNPVSVTDVMDGTKLKSGSSMKVKVPCGLFRFLDIEISKPLTH